MDSIKDVFKEQGLIEKLAGNRHYLVDVHGHARRGESIDETPKNDNNWKFQPCAQVRQSMGDERVQTLGILPKC